MRAKTKPNLARPLPALAPILPPDTLPATEPVLASEATPAATPILGYRLKRSVKMVACQTVPLAHSRDDLMAALANPTSGPDFIPATYTSIPGTPPVLPLEISTTPRTPPGWVGPTPPGVSPPGTPPGSPPVSAVPEPATWAMLIFGFFGLGARLRSAAGRSRRASATPTRTA